MGRTGQCCVAAAVQKDLVGTVGAAVGTIFEKVSKLGPKPVETVGALVKETLGALAGANRELHTGGIQLPRLQLEQGRELLELVSKVSGRPMVLVLDQWEKSPSIGLEGNVLEGFVRHADKWPGCHIFLGLRAEEHPLRIIRELWVMAPNFVEVYDLPPMHLEVPGSCDTLLGYIRQRVPAATAIGSEELLNMVGGYAGTVARWTSDYYARKISSAEEFRSLADDANNYRYKEVGVLLESVTEGERRLALRLAVFPAVSSDQVWSQLRNEILDDLEPKYLDALKRKKLLESSPPPSYGHATRHEAMLHYAQANFGEELREECAFLIFKFAGHVCSYSPEVYPFVNALTSLQPVAREIDVPALFQALCHSALSYFEPTMGDPQVLHTAVEKVVSDQSCASIAPLLAIGLEQDVFASRFNATARRDVMLDDLSRLAAAFPNAPRVLLSRARALYQVLTETKDVASCNAFVDELRKLARAMPADAELRLKLAHGLYAVLTEATKLDDLNAALDELRQLARDYANDAEVRQWLGNGLYAALYYAQQKGSIGTRDALLDELRDLSRSHRDDRDAAIALIWGLQFVAACVTQEDRPERSRELLEELRVAKAEYARLQ